MSLWRSTRRTLDRPLIRRRLATYPPFVPPHPEHPASLSSAQAEENLAHHVATTDERVGHVRAFLAADGVEADAMLHPGKHEAAFAAFDRWALLRYPQMYEERFASEMRAYLTSDKAGPDIVLSLIRDIGVLLGEALRAGYPEYAWGLDEAIRTADEDYSFQRPVLINTIAPRRTRLPRVVDTEDGSVGSFVNTAEFVRMGFDRTRPLNGPSIGIGRMLSMRIEPEERGLA